MLLDRRNGELFLIGKKGEICWVFLMVFVFWPMRKAHVCLAHNFYFWGFLFSKTTAAEETICVCEREQKIQREREKGFFFVFENPAEENFHFPEIERSDRREILSAASRHPHTHSVRLNCGLEVRRSGFREVLHSSNLW